MHVRNNAPRRRHAPRQRPALLVLRCCSRSPHRRPAPAPGPCPATPPSHASAPPCAAAAMPAPLLPAIAQSSARAKAHVHHHTTTRHHTPPHASAPFCDTPVPCQCPALRRCGHTRPVVTCNSAKQRTRQSPRPPPRHRHATTRRPTLAPRRPVTPAPLRPRTPRRHLQQGKRPDLRRCGLARPITSLQQGIARSTERQPGGERARNQV